MTNPLDPVPDYDRLVRTNDPSTGHMNPPVFHPVENANQVVSKVAVLMNRSGSAEANPILSGLGGRIAFGLDRADSLRGLYVFTDRANRGPDRSGDVVVLAPGMYAWDVIHGIDTDAGDHETGAVLNYLRIESAFGVTEGQFWVQSRERDAVTVNRQASVDENLDPVTIEAEIIDPDADWLELPIDFMPGWNDEFHALHRKEGVLTEDGFLKAYGGAKFVSWFDTDESEGVGDEVNPVTDQPIESMRTVQLENEAGVKEFTVRFRSKAGSSDFVDVPVVVNVVDQVAEDCKPPFLTPCADILLLAGTDLPANTPDEASSPGVPVVAGTEGSPLASDLLYIAVIGTAANAGTKLRLRRWGHAENAQKIDGYEITEIGTADDYIPLKIPAFGSPPAGYNDPEIHAIALSPSVEAAVGVAWYTASILDGDMESNATLIPGPLGRQVQSYPPGGDGGGTGCCGPEGCVADPGGE